MLPSLQRLILLPLTLLLPSLPTLALTPGRTAAGMLVAGVAVAGVAAGGTGTGIAGTGGRFKLFYA
jgi:hypothetical protein